MNKLEQLKRELLENKNKCIQIEKKIEELEKQEIGEENLRKLFV